MAKVKNIRNELKDNKSLLDYMNSMDDEEIDFKSKKSLISNWERIQAMPQNPLTATDSNDLKKKVISWLAEQEQSEEEIIKRITILKLITPLKLDEEVQESIIKKANEIAIGTRENRLNTDSEPRAPLDLGKMNTAFGKEFTETVKKMQNGSRNLHTNDNLKKLAENPYKALILSKMDPLTEARFNKVIEADTTGKNNILGLCVAEMQKKQVPITENFINIANKTPHELRAITALFRAIKPRDELVNASKMRQEDFDVIIENSHNLLGEDKLRDKDKISAVTTYINLMAETKLDTKSRLENIMKLDTKRINNINNILTDLNESKGLSTLSASGYKAITKHAATPAVETSKAVIDNIKLIQKARGSSWKSPFRSNTTDNELNTLIEINPLQTNILLNHLKPLSSERVDVVLTNANNLTEDKMNKLTPCITQLVNNKIPLTKNDNLSRLMGMDATQLNNANQIMAALDSKKSFSGKPVTQERFNVIADNISNVKEGAIEPLKKSITTLEKYNVPLTQNDTLKTLMQMSPVELEAFNQILDTLSDKIAPANAYKDLAASLPGLCNLEKEESDNVQNMEKLNNSLQPIDSIPETGIIDRVIQATGMGEKSQLHVLAEKTLQAPGTDIEMQNFAMGAPTDTPKVPPDIPNANTPEASKSNIESSSPELSQENKNRL